MRRNFIPRWVAGIASALLGLTGCSEELTVGEWVCSQDGSRVAAATDRVGLPWSTDFERRFCDYVEPEGFCYADQQAAYALVTDPVHSGRYAASFSVNTTTEDGQQTRCVRQGMLPTAAYYGAWYFLPAPASSAALWNLWHFRGGVPSSNHGLWDVSLVDGPAGSLELTVYDFLNATTYRADTRRAVPIGRWFHIELYLKRAADTSGEVALYQDDEQLLSVKGLRTDDSNWGQWYVGNLAYSLDPAESTLFVDDITISASR